MTNLIATLNEEKIKMHHKIAVYLFTEEEKEPAKKDLKAARPNNIRTT